jgi:hypothetical protein
MSTDQGFHPTERTGRSGAEEAAQQAHDSDWMDVVARIGFVAYGVVYLTIGWLAVQLALGNRQGKASSTGAMHELARQPFGHLLIWAVSIGMFLLVLATLLEAVAGHRDETDHGKRLRKRLASGGKAIIYTVIAFSGIKVATGSGGSSGNGQKAWTAKVMDHTGGQLLVGAIAVAIIAFGGYQIYRAFTEKFADHLDAEGRTGTSGKAYLAFGSAGYIARGIAFIIVGGLFGYAALTHDASKSGGLDQALKKVLDQPFGPVLLCLLGAGLASYGLFMLARARHLSR